MVSRPLTEKLHGTNSRVGLIPTDDGPQWMAGSHAQRKKAPRRASSCLYWLPLTDSVKRVAVGARFAGRA
jgi:hypothetical protein